LKISKYATKKTCATAHNTASGSVDQNCAERPPDDKARQKEQRRIIRQDASECNAVEVKFGEDKRRYVLARIMARLKEIAESVICLQFLEMNLNRRLRVFLFFFLRYLLGQNRAWLCRTVAW